MKLRFFLFYLVIGLTIPMQAQENQALKQTVRGTVTDKVSGETLIGAVVTVFGSDPTIASASDLDGNFRLSNVPVGRRTFTVVLMGYKSVTLSDILVNSGKELVLNVAMEEELVLTSEVTITAQENKKEPLNAMAGVSTRTFSVEETQKFAAAVNDPSRMATSFAGVVSGDDGNNKISIRGNSPYGLLWRMEGSDIPNPNHFANPMSSGGGISILSAQTLSNSDFFTGAFPAEYGNALSGVFDLRLRKGNNEKREYTLQAGFMGLDAAVEGPFSKNYKGSYLVNYRYSTLSILDKVGVPLDGVTNFQDVSFNFYFPTNKAGNFELYGFGGLSDQKNKAVRDTSEWDYSWQRYDSRYFSNTGAIGLKHVINLNEKTYLQSAVVLSGNHIGYEQEKLDDDFSKIKDYEESDSKTRALGSLILNHKFNARHHVRAGAYYNVFGFQVYKKYLDLNDMKFYVPYDRSGETQTVQTFAQWKFRVTEQLTLNTGFHYLRVNDNGTDSFEPRFSARYQINEDNTVTLGYGLHSQMQAVSIYNTTITADDLSISRPNKNLDLNKAHHFVAGYERSLTKYLYVKSELYYQSLFNIAISPDSGSTFSTLNSTEGVNFGKLVNHGLGRNYGAELTLEQFTHHNMYFLLSASIYNSEYRAQDKVWRNTQFNTGHALSFTAGKEFNVGKVEKNKQLGINMRMIYTGGMRRTPIDIEASLAKGETVTIDSKAFSEQNKDYLRFDVRISLRTNHAKSTSTLALDLLNATNHKNVYGQYFEPESGSIRTIHQVPLLPVLSYKLEF
ncbi:MAG: TonB-dependent receptor [Flavobacteriales bacterium]|nr:TonB-dependent receptor [Flavobacteriales bacterium]